MAGATKKCQLDSCDRAASTKCFCCKKKVCTKHFMEHIDAVKAQLDPLANETNEMVENIQGLTVDKITEISFGELQQWRCDMYQLIDEIFLAKTKEMKDLIATNKEKFVEHRQQQLETTMKIQDQVKQLAEDGDATYEQIQSRKNQLTTVQTNLTSFGKDFLSVNARVVAEGLVTVSSKFSKAAPPTPLIRQKSKSKQSATSDYSSSENSKPVQSGFIFGTTPSPPTTTSLLNPLWGGSQNNPATHSSVPTATSSMFGSAPPSAANSLRPTVSFSPSGSGNNASPSFSFLGRK